MSYTVLARKYRPQTFADLVGQEHVSRTLANAITGGRVAHAFLFTGARGVGKTTTARLLAKALNCEQGPTPTPCNSCDPCREITLGTDLDVLEIDGQPLVDLPLTERRARLEALLDRRSSTVKLSETRYTARTMVQGVRVLLAEDGEDNRRLIAHLLRRVGVELTWVENGARAIEEHQRARAAGQPFDLVLMDMQMPVLDGYSAVRRLRALGVRTPIMALTANAMNSDRQRCLDAGCDEFCAKPIDFDQFFAALERCLGTGHTQTPPALPSPKPAEDVEIKDESFAQLVELFVRELGEDVETLHKLLAGGQLEELERLAHQLKGSCGSYGFPELSRHAAELERCVKESAERPALAAALGAFEKCCAEARSSSSV